MNKGAYRFVVFLILPFLLLALGRLSPGWACSRYPQPPLPTVGLTIETPNGEHLVLAELAASPEQTSCGLMGRTDLPPGTGMLFDMRPAGPAWFWMKNTLLPLDIVFIGPAGEVAHVAPDTTPFSTRSVGIDANVAAVLEVAAGQAARLGIRPGTRVALPWLKR